MIAIPWRKLEAKNYDLPHACLSPRVQTVRAPGVPMPILGTIDRPGGFGREAAIQQSIRHAAQHRIHRTRGNRAPRRKGYLDTTVRAAINSRLVFGALA